MLVNKVKSQKSKVKSQFLGFGICSPLKEKGTFLFLMFPNQQKNRNVPFILLFLILSFGICHYLSAQEQFSYDAKGKRNPFISLVNSEGRLVKLDKEEASGELVIEGLIYDKNGRSYAIVNATVVGIGDSVSGYEVLKIEPDKIIFAKEGQLTEVEFKKED